MVNNKNKITDNQIRDITFYAAGISDGAIQIEKVMVLVPDNPGKNFIMSQLLKININLQLMDKFLLSFPVDRNSEESAKYFELKMSEAISLIQRTNDAITKIIESKKNG